VVATVTGPEPLVNNHVLHPEGTENIVIVHRRHLTFLDTLGQFKGRFGRQGAGPGEFLGQLVVGTRADSVWTADRALARGLVISSVDLGFRTNELLFDGGSPRNGVLRWGLLKGMPAPDVFVASGSVPKTASNDAVGAVVVASAVHPDSLLRILLDDSQSGECVVPNAGRPVMFLDCFRTMHLIAPNGRSASAVRRVGDLPGGMTVQVVRVSYTGDTLVSSIIRLPAQEMTAELLESRLAKLAEIVKHPVAGRGFVPPTRIPPVRYGYQGNDGSLWLAGHTTVGGLEWYLVTPDGLLGGRFVLDPDLTIGAVSRDGAWAVSDLENGDAEVVRITIQP
jgi:hypothetical protein